MNLLNFLYGFHRILLLIVSFYEGVTRGTSMLMPCGVAETERPPGTICLLGQSWHQAELFALPVMIVVKGLTNVSKANRRRMLNCKAQALAMLNMTNGLMGDTGQDQVAHPRCLKHPRKIKELTNLFHLGNLSTEL